MKKTKILLGVATVLMSLSVAGSSVSAKEVKENDNIYYVVESGDTLSSIADKYEVDFTTVHGNNEKEVEHADVINVGQKLLVGGKDFDKEKAQAYSVPQSVVISQEVVTYEQPVQEYVEIQEQVVVSQVPTQSYSGNSSSAKEWIAQRESNGSYSAMNGQYVGRYQLTDSYLNGDYSPENQERVADKYVADRYGSWENAQAFWMNNGWY